MSTICHRSHCRGDQCHGRGRWCFYARLRDGFPSNSWFISHIRYTAAFLYHLLTRDIQRRTVKRILPSSSTAEVTSASTNVATDEDVQASLIDESFSGRQQTSVQHDTEVEEFQSEVRDFIQNLCVPSTAAPVNTAAYLFLG